MLEHEPCRIRLTLYDYWLNHSPIGYPPCSQQAGAPQWHSMPKLIQATRPSALTAGSRRGFEHAGGVKAMTDEQLEQGIEAITQMLEARTGESAKVIEGVVEPAPIPRKTRRKRRKTDQDMVTSMGSEPEPSNS